MKTKKRQKLCYNCEGEVDLDVIVCPFCAADLRVEKPEVQRPAYDPTMSVKNLNTQQSLYPPHYSSGQMQEEEVSQEEPQYAQEQPQYAQEESHYAQQEEMTAPIEEGEPKSIFGPTILLTLGMQLLLFGLFMLFFSHDGLMTFQLDARLWFFYLLAAIPLIIFGYRSLSKL